MSDAGDGQWRVGELAEATGLTVRTLHHYHEIGLLAPSQRTGAGHRLYGEEEIRRLYRILALRRLGLRLDEIAALLDEGGLSLVETVRRHLRRWSVASSTSSDCAADSSRCSRSLIAPWSRRSTSSSTRSRRWR